MLLFHAFGMVCELTAGWAVRIKLGTVGLLLLATVAVGIRARHNGLAVGAAVVLVMLMTQA